MRDRRELARLALRTAVTGVVALTLAVLTVSASAAAGRPRVPSVEKIGGEAAGFAAGSGVASVVRFRRQFVAVGSVFTTEPPVNATSFEPYAGAVWTSTDGHAWQRVSTDFGSGSFTLVIASPAQLVAFQEPLGNGGSQTSTAVWSSTDGATWHLVTDQAPQGIRTAIFAGHTLIGAGSEPTSRPCLSFTCFRAAIWTSADGRVWNRVGTPSDFPPGSVSRLVRAVQGYLAVGDVIGSSQRTGNPLIWTSATGKEWRRVHRPTGLSAVTFGSGAIASNIPTVLGVGYRLSRSSSSSSSTTTTTTTTTAPPTSAGGLTSVARLCATLDGTLGSWTTSDGTHWHQRATRSLGNFTVSHLARGRGTWIVAGSQGDCTSTRAVLYQSTDGVRWQQLASDPKRPASTAVRFPTALTATPDGGLMFVSSLDLVPNGATEIWIWSDPAAH